MTEGVWVVATVSLPAGLPRDGRALVNPDDPYIARLLEQGYLVRDPAAVDAGSPAAEVPSSGVDDERG